MTARASTLVSTTRRRGLRMNRRASVFRSIGFQNVGKDFLGHAPLCGFSADAVHRLLKLGDVEPANALVFLCGNDHRNIAILAANEDRFALGGVEKRRKALFGISSGDGTHLSILDKLDKDGQPALIT